jgi:hypothetical protein
MQLLPFVTIQIEQHQVSKHRTFVIFNHCSLQVMVQAGQPGQPMQLPAVVLTAFILGQFGCPQQ